MAVVTALEFQDFRAPGGATRHAQRRHHRFSAGIHEAQHLHPGYAAGDVLGELEAVWLGRAQAPATAHGAFDSLAHGGIAMPEDHGSEGHAEIEVLAPVHIDETRPAPAGHEHPSSPDAPEGR